jgi:hypothetical protein
VLAVKFPAAFTHSDGHATESNRCTCDIDRDDFGLQYWFYGKGYDGEKKTADLYEIVYGSPTKKSDGVRGRSCSLPEILARSATAHGNRVPMRPQDSNTESTFVMLSSSRIRGVTFSNSNSHFAPFAEM